jgi:hypothetical protein
MSKIFSSRDRSAFLHHGRSNQDESRAKEVPLSRRTELASDALVAGKIVILMNSVVSKQEIAKSANLSLVDDGIQLAKRLEEGEIYLDQRKFHLIQQPESADTVKYIRARGTSNLRECIQEALSILSRIRDSLDNNSPMDFTAMDLQLAKSTRAFFRIIHTSIIDQLGAFEIPSRHIT